MEGKLRPKKVVALLDGCVGVQVLAEADEHLRERADGHKDNAFVVFAPLDKVGVETNIVAEVVCNHGTPVQSGVAKVLLVRDAHVPFTEGMSRLVAVSLERIRHMDVYVLVKVDPDP